MMTNGWLSRTAGSGPALMGVSGKAIFTLRLSHMAGPCSRGREGGDGRAGRGLVGQG